MNPDPPFFQTFGNINILRYVGILPFKVQTHENGKSMVDTVDWKIQLLLFIVYFTLIYGFCFCCLYIVLVRSDIDLFQFFCDGFKSLSGTNLTTSQMLDDHIEGVAALLSMFVGGVMVIGLNHQRQNICKAFGFLTDSYQHCPLAWQYYKGKMTQKAIILAIVNGVFTTVLALAMTLHFKKNLELDKLNTFLVFLANLIFMASVYIVQFGYFSIFGDFVALTSTWMVALRDQFDIDGHNLLRNTQDLQKSLKTMSKALSKCTFYAMIIWLINLILIAFRVLSYFMSFDRITEQELVYAVAYSFMAIQHLLFIFYMNVASQEMMENVQELKKTIKGTNMDELKIPWEGKFESTSFVKNIILDDLAEFQGFDGNGYFTLGKAFYSSIIANFLTYLIILIQTKLTLISSFDQKAMNSTELFNNSFSS